MRANDFDFPLRLELCRGFLQEGAVPAVRRLGGRSHRHADVLGRSEVKGVVLEGNQKLLNVVKVQLAVDHVTVELRVPPGIDQICSTYFDSEEWSLWKIHICRFIT